MVTPCGPLDPPAPLHVNVKVAVLVSVVVDSLPAVPRAPVHAPEAVHEVALVDVQVSMEVPFTLTSIGEAIRLTVGAGELPFTATCALRVMLPPAPVHCRV